MGRDGLWRGYIDCFDGSDDEVSNLADYGRLYNWYAVDDARGLCPSGWHVPTDEEYTTLTDGLGGTSVAGGKMKSSPEDSPVMGRHEHERFFRFGWWLPGLHGDFTWRHYGYFWSASAYGATLGTVTGWWYTEVDRYTTTYETVFQFVAFGIKNVGLWGA